MKNVGTIDQIIRIVLGLVLLGAIVLVQGPLRWIGLIGLVPLLTGLVNYCPLYSIFGIRTRRL
ncbi:YgaP family membrane protein [Terriglobus tenax]|uniref:YgaP family membrane protein n=1 Tax=Terriglobus tenax TaxID=1111115 RepID=UPI0021DFF216|nr:DUF2892 domain-containing protein [Terriglobus tenax]